ncbi:MAG: hypothetical protein OXN97_24195 [Bryobacterales bacterium]|nr:hypothetical protein [Bryobacterales bacterium]
MRKSVGILGVSMPVILGVYGRLTSNLQTSISAYYDTAAGSVFAGTLFAVGFYLLAYKGYDKTDDILGDIACVCAISVAVFPHEGWTKLIHFSAAAILFLTLAAFCYQFTRSNTAPRMRPRGKRRRNAVYWICGASIILGILAIAVSKMALKSIIPETWPVVFVIETVMLLTFGVSWFVKGSRLPCLR